MPDSRRVCDNCEHYRPFRGVMECWSQDSDHMYKPTLSDDSCEDFEPKEEFFKEEVSKYKQPIDCMGCWYYKTAEVCQKCCRNYRDQYTPENTKGE